MALELLRDYPGLPTGSVFVLDADGIYREAAGGPVWLTAQAVADNAASFDVVDSFVVGEPYFYVGDAGGVLDVEWSGSEVDIARKRVRNAFATRAAAEDALQKLASVLQTVTTGAVDGD